jgi:hypothetical protein
MPKENIEHVTPENVIEFLNELYTNIPKTLNYDQHFPKVLRFPNWCKKFIPNDNYFGKDTVIVFEDSTN